MLPFQIRLNIQPYGRIGTEANVWIYILPWLEIQVRDGEISHRFFDGITEIYIFILPQNKLSTANTIWTLPEIKTTDIVD